MTRRTTRRYFLLRPDDDGTMQSLYWYTTAVYAKKFGIEIHAVQVLSTHIHEVLTDVYGNLPAFLRERNRVLANAVKAHRRWAEEVFQRASASCVELYGPDAVAQKIGYTIANCVEAGLVSDPRAWPGVTTHVDDMGMRVIEVERPAVYFDENNRIWPPVATLKITAPKVLLDTFDGHEPALAFVRRKLSALLSSARAALKKTGRRFPRIAELVRAPFTRTAATPEDRGTGNPTFAAGGNPVELRRAIEEKREFLAAYRVALEALGNGFLGVPFPEGTWRWCRELIPPLPVKAVFRAA